MHTHIMQIKRAAVGVLREKEIKRCEEGKDVKLRFFSYRFDTFNDIVNVVVNQLWNKMENEVGKD